MYKRQVSELLKRIINNINLVLDDNSKTGKLILEYASKSEKQFFQLIPNSIIIRAITNIRGGTSLVGEIILDQLGLKGSEEQSPKTYLEEVQFRLKNILKRWAKQKLSIEGFISPSSKRIS